VALQARSSRTALRKIREVVCISNSLLGAQPTGHAAAHASWRGPRQSDFHRPGSVAEPRGRKLPVLSFVAPIRMPRTVQSASA
jgi:hypothetical protein